MKTARISARDDLAFFWSLDHEKYLAYEAKRLNVMTSTGISSPPDLTLKVSCDLLPNNTHKGCLLGLCLVTCSSGDELPKDLCAFEQ